MRPPLGLSAVLTDANGASTRRGSEDLNPENIPQGLTWSTQRMQGFAAGSLSLARRIDRDYVDVHLADSVDLVGDDGSTAYEGRVSALPRSMDTAHSMGVQLQGWMAETKRSKFTEIYVDRDLSQWGAMSRGGRAANLAAGYTIFDPGISSDRTLGVAALTTEVQDSWPVLPLCQAFYDAGDARIGKIYYTWTRTGSMGTAAPWVWQIGVSASDAATAPSEGTGSLAAAGPSSGTFMAVSECRYGIIELYYNAAAGSAGYRYGLDWTNLAVYGRHGLPLIGTTAPYGVAASDVLRHLISSYCPKLNTAGIRDTTYPIPQLAFRDRTFPYDAILELNKHHLWDCSVWENRTVHYGGIDLTDYDWEIRLDDPGVTTSLQGDDLDQLANGIAVQFPNVQTGQTQVITPDEYPELLDTSVENPFNQHGDKAWTEYSLSFPTTLDAALQIGRAALAEYNAPKAPGTITAQHYIRDRQGHWQPVWKVRANQRVAITSSSSLSDRPRIIHETTYTHDSHSLSMAVDSTFKRLDAEIDRISTALAAAGLT